MATKTILDREISKIQSNLDGVTQFFATATEAQYFMSKAHYDSLDTYLAKLEQWETDAIQFNASLEAQSSNEIKVNKESNRVRDKIISCRAKHFKIEQDYNHSQGQNQNVTHASGGGQGSPTNCSSVSFNAELKSIPVFSGSFNNYKSFIELFTKIVDGNINVSPLQKLLYLRSKLVDEPLQLIDNLSLDSNGYSEAIKKLKDRYSSPRVSCGFQLNEILSFKGNNKKVSHTEFLKIHESAVYNMVNAGVKDLSNFILFHICYLNLDPKLRTEFDISCTSAEPGYSELFSFIQSRAKSEQINAVLKETNKVDYKAGFRCPKTVNVSRSDGKHDNPNDGKNSNQCPFCSQNHFIYNCKKLLDKQVSDRYEVVKDLRLCFNCLGPHSRAECKSKSTCKVCKARHNSLLHYHKDNRGDTGQSGSSNNVKAVSFASNKNNDVLLSTIRATSRDSKGNSQFLTCLLDNGAQINLVTLKCVQKLGLYVDKSSKATILGVGKARTGAIGTVKLRVESSGPMPHSMDVIATVVDEITNSVPNQDISPKYYHQVKKYPLANKFFCKASTIDVLLGNGVFCEILTYPRHGRMFIKGNPSLLFTKFGYICTGQIKSTKQDGVHHALCCAKEEPTLNDTLQTFWEEQDVPDLLSLEDSSHKWNDLEDFYKQTYQREQDGTYVVSLPLKDDKRPGSNKEVALKRYLSLEKKLESDQILKEEHLKQFHDYLDLKHMEKSSKEIEGKYYIPYHYIVKPDSSTTKYRAVFDASSSSPNNYSLNECIEDTPNLNNDLSTILMKFQVGGKYTLTADLSKCYRRIKVSPEDALYQRCFFRENKTEPIQELELKCVVFGIKCSPWLAIRTIRQLAMDEGGAKDFSLAIQAIFDNFYMDDLVKSFHSEEELKETLIQLKQLLAKGNFPIHKFSSNVQKALEEVNQNEQEVLKEFNSSSRGIKVLGLHYDIEQDVFLFSVKEFTGPFTKRNILSFISRLFDPQGFLQPIVFLAKHFIQRMWIDGMSWDEPIKDDLLQEWLKFSQSIWRVKDVRITRHIPVQHEVVLIGTCDASIKGFSANVYVHNNKAESRLIKAKSRLAPIKQLSIPRLELDAILLVANLLNDVIKNSGLSVKQVIICSDSQVALSWCKSSQKKHPRYVSNRVTKIKQLTNGFSFKYINTKDNPSDYSCRGLNGDKFIEIRDMWFNGPAVFRDVNSLADYTGVEQSALVAGCVEPNPLYTYSRKFSSLGVVIRVFAYVRRFINNSRNKEKQTSPLSISEMLNAERTLVKMSQENHLAEEIKQVSRDKGTGSLSSLAPFIDSDGLLRVGGRLVHSPLSFDSKHPIILSKNCHLVPLLIQDCHHRYFHAGPNYILASLRRKYWIVNGKSKIRKVIKECTSCKRFKGQTMSQIMSDLPPQRVVVERAFSHVGCDFGGPIMIKTSKLRKAPMQKAYFAIFICLSTKACHIEITTELTTESFLAALERFCCRRGLPKCIYTDCGSNFIGARNNIKEITAFLLSNNDTIFSSMASKSIEWKLNVPYGQHMGGIWERQVRSIKEHLYKQVNPKNLTYEEFNTVIIFIEAILNSRPMTPLDENSDNLDVLTPGHFLIGSNIFSVPQQELGNRTQKTRWLMVQQTVQSLWKRYYAEYLHTLQQRNKWRRVQEDLAVGYIVLLKDMHSTPLNYPLGRVMEVIKSKDGHVRMAKVKTSAGLYERPITGLIPLCI